MKVAIITCYKDPEYIRAQTLRMAVQAQPDTEAIIIKNKFRGWLRYPEVMIKLAAVRLKRNPDAYLLTFRGYEILPFVLFVALRKPVIFDEFINLIEWVVYEHHKIKENGRPARLLARYYNHLLRKCSYILADTPEHAAYSISLSGVDDLNYRSIPVSANELLFNPMERQLTKKDQGTFQVFYYGNMLPLHGLEHVLEAAVMLKDQPIEFLLIGGKASAQQAINQAQTAGAKITYKSWVDFADLPHYVASADLCLSGPFGDTPQAQLVITGKTYQFLAGAAPTVIGQTKATAVFRDKVDCLLVPLGNDLALAGVITWAQTHRAELAAIGKNGQALYERYFSQAVVDNKLGAVLNNLRLNRQ